MRPTQHKIELENKGKIKVINLKKDKGVPYDLYMGRQNDFLGLNGSKWANPFHLKREGDRPMVLEQHMQYMKSRPDLLAQLHELKNKTLACYCCNYSKETGF